MFVGISNWISCSGTTDIPQKCSSFIIANALDDWDYFAKASPIKYLDKHKAVAHHARKADPRVNPGQSLSSTGISRSAIKRRCAWSLPAKATQPPGSVPARLQHSSFAVDGDYLKAPAAPCRRWTSTTADANGEDLDNIG